MTSSVYNYEIFCITDQKFVSGWGTSPPNKCYENDTHEINPNSISIVNTISENKVYLENKNVPPGSDPISGLYKCDTIRLTCPPNTKTTFVFQKPFPVCINILQFNLSDNNVGDYVDVVSLPNTIIGTLRDDVAVGSNTIPVKVETLPYFQRGYALKLSNGAGTTDNLGFITNINATNLEVTVSVPTTNSFVKDTTLILTERVIIDKYFINVSGFQIFGRSKIETSYVPTGVSINVTYDNRSNVTKDFVASYDYYY